jgi:hypothetical protein
MPSPSLANNPAFFADLLFSSAAFLRSRGKSPICQGPAVVCEYLIFCVNRVKMAFSPGQRAAIQRIAEEEWFR